MSHIKTEQSSMSSAPSPRLTAPYLVCVIVWHNLSMVFLSAEIGWNILYTMRFNFTQKLTYDFVMVIMFPVLSLDNVLGIHKCLCHAMQYVPRVMFNVFFFGTDQFYPYPSGLFLWHWVYECHSTAEYPWRIWVDISHGCGRMTI